MKYFLNTKVVLTISVAWVAFSIGLSICHHDCLLMEVAGAVSSLVKSHKQL